MKNKSNQKIESYIDIPTEQMYAFADKEGLNTDSPENFREAAQELFKRKYAKKKTLSSMMERAVNYRPATKNDIGKECANCKNIIQLKNKILTCICMVPEQFIN